jgi:hypothetical protein
MQIEDRVLMVEQLATQRQSLKVELRKVNAALTQIFEPFCLAVQREAFTQTSSYLSDDLMYIMAREEIRNDEEHARLSLEWERLTFEISEIEAKLERERSLVSLALYGSAGESESEPIGAIH